jgi:DNA repair photolyase
VGADDDAVLPGLGLAGLVRSVRTPEFAGVTFHEVLARTAVNRVAAPMPFRWSLNPMRGCLHGCVFCYARRTHEFLDLGPGDDFARQVVVKTNVADVLRAELARPTWAREHVAVGTISDPYQRAEGRYRLMPEVVRAFADAATPFSVTTRGTLLRRDLPLLAEAATRVRVGVNVSLGLLDERLARALEPGAPSPRARLELVAAVRDAGLPCHVFVAPVLPWLTDDVRALDELLGAVVAAGASAVTVLSLRLPGSVRDVFLGWLAAERPDLVGRYRALYRGASAPEYGRRLAARVRPLLARHGLARPRDRRPPAPPAAVPAPLDAPTLF